MTDLGPGTRPATHRSRTLRLTSSVAYLTVARHLPWSPRPGGALAKRVRRFLAVRMLDHCGVEVNIERGAHFGSGLGIEVGDRSAIGMDALVIGPLVIGADVMMGPRCMLISASHAHALTSVPMNQQGYLAPRPIVIEDDVWIGAGVTVLAGVRIGTGSLIGAGSVVSRSVPPWSVAVGNPARVVRSRMSRETV